MGRLTCPHCQGVYGGNRGGHCMSCHQTFSNDATGDRHRPVGGPCLTPEQMRAKGWRETPNGWTHNRRWDER